MSTQIEIDKKLTKYLQEIGYRSDKIIDELVAETLALGNVARMQIAPEQGQFLEIIAKISKAKNSKRSECKQSNWDCRFDSVRK